MQTDRISNADVRTVKDEQGNVRILTPKGYIVMDAAAATQFAEEITRRVGFVPVATQKDRDAAAGAALRRMSAERLAKETHPDSRVPYLAKLAAQKYLDAIRKLCAEACDTCDGTGTVGVHWTDANGIEHDADDQPCSACGGTGVAK